MILSQSKLTTLFLLFSTLQLLSCGQSRIDVKKGEKGLDGLNGSNYASYSERISVQDIAGDGLRIEIQASENGFANEFVVVPTITEIVADNTPNCSVTDAILTLETDSETVEYRLEQVSRYKMQVTESSVPVGTVLRSKGFKVYFSQPPKCGEQELHAGATLTIYRLFKVL